MKKEILNNMKLINVSTKHMKLLFTWANDKLVRSNALNENEIIWEAHVNWFLNRVNSKFTKMYILEDKGNNIGQIRFDYNKDSYYWVISYSIDVNYRGMGYGSKIIQKGLEIMNRENILAIVKTTNIPSQKIFKRVGFLKSKTMTDNDLITYVLERDQS